MEVTPLTRQHWLLVSLITGISTFAGAALWQILANLLVASVLPSFSFVHQAIQALTLLVSAFLIYFLMLLRLMLARRFWLKIWTVALPLVASSFLSLPVPAALTLPAVWIITMLCALWGYYWCFSPLMKQEHGLHTARFARRHELADLYTLHPPDTSLLLGVNHRYGPFRRFLCVRPLHNRRVLGNMMVVAPTQIGKSILATTQLLSWRHSAIVNDIKGELFEHTAGWRATLGPVYVLDPIRGVGHCYDPLLGKNTEEKIYSIAFQMLDDTNEKERIWTEKAARMLQQLFLAAKKEGVPGLVSVRRMSRLGLSEVIGRLNAIDPSLANQFSDGADISNRMLQDCWSTLTAKLHPFLTETVVRSFTQADFTPEQLMRGNRPVTVYLRWREQDLHALSPLVRLLWGSLIDELITTYDTSGGKGCKPVLILIDEAGKTAIPSLADQAVTVVGRGISFWLAIQSISQLETIYGKARAQTLVDNIETKLYHRTNDLATAQYLEERCGTISGFARSTTEREGAARSEGQSERPIPLITAQEVMTMKDHEIIGFHRFLRPFKLHRLEWWRYPFFRERQSIKAPLLPALLPALETPEIPGDGGKDPAPSHTYLDPYLLPEDDE